jgi:AraC family transcriptional regulator of adaptative response/methylated-DNA-[protein]-cysteine methyltransferase
MMLTSDANLDDGRCWAAVCARDPAADGSFVFAVRTTGVFCRPPCAARRPLRANVTFFATPAQARAAGFRACKRCHPDASSAEATLVAIVDRACRAIDAAETTPVLSELAAAAGKSPFHFQRLFTRIVGLSPRDYFAARRATELRSALSGSARVADAIYAAGFGSSSRAYTLAASTLGMTPSAYRAGGAGERIRFAAVPTPLGWIAAALTRRGVAAIEIGDERAVVTARITERFAAADLAEDETELRAVLAAIVQYIERPATGLDLSLDVQGTAFARRVWRALTELGPGQTATYAQIARAIGRPGAARAVGSACAANPVALAIPCHRVVPAGGGTGGYRWGAERKRRLLAGEAE